MKLDIVVGALLPVCINPQYNFIRELKHHSVERQGSVSSHHRSITDHHRQLDPATMKSQKLRRSQG